MSYDPLYDAARKAVDDVLGEGEYARLNRNNPGVPRELRGVLRVIVRGFGDGVKVFEDSAEIADAALEHVIGKMAEAHMLALVRYRKSMVEFEFPDMPENERFLRFGTDPSRMVIPIEVNLNDPS